MAGFEWGEPRADAQLVAAALAGDKAAFAELVRRHRHVAATLAARMLGDDDLARDVVQEATVVALVSLGRLRSPTASAPGCAASPSTWLDAGCPSCARRRRVCPSPGRSGGQTNRPR